MKKFQLSGTHRPAVVCPVRRLARQPAVFLPAPVGAVPEPTIGLVENWYEQFRDREQD